MILSSSNKYTQHWVCMSDTICYCSNAFVCVWLFVCWCVCVGGSGSWFTEWKASERWRKISAGRYRWAKQRPASSVTCGVCFHSQREAVPNSYQPAECLKVIQEKKVRNPHSSPPTQRRVRLRKLAVYAQRLQDFCVWPFVLLSQCLFYHSENDFTADCVDTMCTNHVLFLKWFHFFIFLYCCFFFPFFLQEIVLLAPE